jgi:hypothetical protein
LTPRAKVKHTARKTSAKRDCDSGKSSAKNKGSAIKES